MPDASWPDWRGRPRSFDASRYFRDSGNLGFYNVGSDRVRTLAKTIVRLHQDVWTVRDVSRFADLLVRDRYLEAKGVGIEAMARYRRRFTPPLLQLWKRWLSRGDAANWATTDAICGLLIGPLLLDSPAARRRRWRRGSRDPSMWVRRASVVGLIPLARRGQALDLLYATARRLHRDDEDLIQKAVGWALREAGKSDMEQAGEISAGQRGAYPAHDAALRDRTVSPASAPAAAGS